MDTLSSEFFARVLPEDRGLAGGFVVRWSGVFFAAAGFGADGLSEVRVGAFFAAVPAEAGFPAPAELVVDAVFVVDFLVPAVGSGFVGKAGF